MGLETSLPDSKIIHLTLMLVCLSTPNSWSGTVCLSLCIHVCLSMCVVMHGQMRDQNYSRTLHNCSMVTRKHFVFEHLNFIRACCIFDFSQPPGPSLGVCYRMSYRGKNYCILPMWICYS